MSDFSFCFFYFIFVLINIYFLFSTSKKKLGDRLNLAERFYEMAINSDTANVQAYVDYGDFLQLKYNRMNDTATDATPSDVTPTTASAATSTTNESESIKMKFMKEELLEKITNVYVHGCRINSHNLMEIRVFNHVSTFLLKYQKYRTYNKLILNYINNTILNQVEDEEKEDKKEEEQEEQQEHQEDREEVKKCGIKLTKDAMKLCYDYCEFLITIRYSFSCKLMFFSFLLFFFTFFS